MKNSSSNKHFRLLSWLPVLMLLISTSCSMALFPGYRTNISTGSFQPRSWFDQDTGHYLFNTGIDVMKNHFSGLMVIKPTGADTVRVIMITEIGLKVLDFGFFSSGETKVYYIMDALDRGMLIRTLTSDLGLLIMQGGNKSPVILEDKKTGDLVYRLQNGNKRNFYHFRDESERPWLARQTNGRTNKAEIFYYANGNNEVDSIRISHNNIALSINLQRIIE